MSEMYHHGIKGMHWGIRKKESVTTDFSYGQEGSKQIKKHSDGSKTFPVGFVFNRVGQETLGLNQSGALYVSYGKQDAARYVKSLGPTLVGKLLGTAGTTIQHISVKEPLKVPSDETVAKETVSLLLSNKKLRDNFNESIYSLVVTEDFTKQITSDDLQKAIKNPSGKDAQKLAYGVSSFLGDGNYADDSKIVYDHFRSKGYDAIPDLHDTLSGTSTSATIVINPKKVNVTSTTLITKDVMSSGKDYVKTLEKLPVSDLIS